MSKIQQLKTKNRKIHKRKPKEQHIPYRIPIIMILQFIEARFVSRFDSDGVKKLEVYSGLHESPFLLSGSGDQINAAYVK